MSPLEDDRDSVSRMIQWLYTDEFDLIDSVCGDTSSEHFMQLAQLNTLAEKYDVYLLKNDIVDALFSHVKLHEEAGMDAGVVRYLYDNTTEASSFRKLMVAWHAYEINFEWYELDTIRDELAPISQEFAIDLAIALGTRLKYPDRKSPFTLPSSNFHEKPLKNAENDRTQGGLAKEADQS